MTTNDKILLLRVPEQWLKDREAELAQHPLYESMSEYLLALIDCGVAALEGVRQSETSGH